MESYEETESVTDCNTNAQIEPETIYVVHVSREMSGSSYREDQSLDDGERSEIYNDLSPGDQIDEGDENVIDEAISLHENAVPDVSIGFMSQSLTGGEDKNASNLDLDEDTDLSDDCSSMSETEFSDVGENEEVNGDNSDLPHLKLSQATTFLNDDGRSEETRDVGDNMPATEAASEERQPPSDSDDVTPDVSVYDDTFTDLTMDSVNLSLMDSCFVDDADYSEIPEISNLEISGSDISFADMEFSSALEIQIDGISEEKNSVADDIVNKVTTANGVATNVTNDVVTNVASVPTDIAKDGDSNYNVANDDNIEDNDMATNVGNVREIVAKDDANVGDNDDKNSVVISQTPESDEASIDSNIHTSEIVTNTKDSLGDELANSPQKTDKSTEMIAQENSDEQNVRVSDEVTSTTDIHDPSAAIDPTAPSTGEHDEYNSNQPAMTENGYAAYAPPHCTGMMHPQQFGYQWPVENGHYHTQQNQQDASVPNYHHHHHHQQQMYYNYGMQQYNHYPSCNVDPSLFDPDQFYPGQLQDLQGPEPTYNNSYVPQFEAQPEASCQEMQNFQYPSVYVSQAGLITVLLKNDVSVEFTVDKTIRMVSHQRRLVIATNSRGSANCLYHPHVKICHDGTTTEVELSDDRKVRMTTENIVIAKGEKCYRFDYNDVQKASVDFRDISKDNSVTLLFGSTGYGPALIPQCLELAQNAQYNHYDDGGFCVRINGISITQTARGDVIVLSGPKFLKMSSQSSYLRLQTHFIDMAAYKNGKIFVRRGMHSLDSNPSSLFVNNGNLETGFEDGNDLSVFRLPRRTPMTAVSRRQRKRPAVPRERQSSRRDWY